MDSWEVSVAVLVVWEHHMCMGDDASRAEAYGKYSDDLVRFATGLVGPSDSGDVVSSAMVSVLWSRGWVDIRDPRAYLYRAVLNEAHRFHRSAMKRRAAEARALASDAVQVFDVRPDVLEAVGRLSAKQRAVVFLVYWEDLTVAETARRLGLSEGTVHRNLARAEGRLGRMLND
jgi:RNA polymerase sigma factor (sigma-70 family)